jgi:adenosylmethionine-8-amino-7-oxononanoate aminotransferase
MGHARAFEFTDKLCDLPPYDLKCVFMTNSGSESADTALKIALADHLERLVALHDASNIACVIVKPVVGSTGVLIPPKGYLQRLRALCDKHDIRLIFDEVITGFGRLRTGFAADYFQVRPDIMCLAKGITNATVPMGGVCVSQRIYDSIRGIELEPRAGGATLRTLEVFNRCFEAGLMIRVTAILSPCHRL